MERWRDKESRDRLRGVKATARATDQIISQVSFVTCLVSFLCVRFQVLDVRSDLSTVSCHMSQKATVRATDRTPSQVSCAT